MPGFSLAQSVIAAMITPALLILASGSLIATVLVRLARVVDRIRKLAEANDPATLAADLDRHERRAQLAARAIQAFFIAIACFVVAGFAIALEHASGERYAWIAIALVSVGMALIVGGCAAMVAETRLSVAQLAAEIARLRR